jgi:hypothetical protein
MASRRPLSREAVLDLAERIERALVLERMA